MFKPHIEKLKEDGANIDIIDIDENRDESHAYQVMSVPTLVFERNGEIYARTSGIVDPARVKEVLEFTS
jgi:predicted thioredoxin/glutaredoxin